MNVEIAMREKSVVDCIKRHSVRWESDAMEIDTEVPTVSETSKHKYCHSTDLEGMAFSRGGQLRNITVLVLVATFLVADLWSYAGSQT